MKNQEVAKLLYSMADLLEMQNVQWKPAALRKAARSIESLSNDLETVYRESGAKGLMEIDGVGEGIARKIIDYLETGRMHELEKIKKKMPKGLPELIHIQGLGPKKAWKLYKALKIDSVEKLEKAAREGKIRKLPTFGEKSEQDILLGIRLLKQGQERQLLGKILPLADDIVRQLRSLHEAKRADVAGSIRRRKETVRDIDVLVVSRQPKKVMDFFTSLPEVQTVLAKGGTKSSVVLKAGINADLRIVEEKSYGAALNYFTGSKDHNVRLRQIAIKQGYKLSEYGLFNDKTNRYICGKTEEELYKKLGAAYIEPEMRENTGEIEMAINNKLPKIVPYGAIKGDLHMHTTWTDGIHSTEDMVKAAINMKYEYIAITDHSKSTTIANGLDEKKLIRRIEELERLQKRFPEILILKGAEVDILKNGDLDYSQATLRKFDVVIASVHSNFKLPEIEMTSRITKAIENPYTTILGHPTGRLINRREPCQIDIDKIIHTAKERNVALEINAHPQRLDLNDINIRKGLKYKAKFVISTDAHSTSELQFMHYGIAQARRGWLASEDIINTLPKERLLKYLKIKRG